MPSLLTYSDYASFGAIVNKLVAFRLKAAEHRREMDFWAQLNPDAKSSPPTSEYRTEVDEMMPPRRQWLRPRKDHRNGLNSIEILKRSLLFTIHKFNNEDRLSKVEWGQRLSAQVEAIQTIWRDPTKWNPSSLEISAKREDSKIRILAKSTNLTDRVVLSLAAHYLSNALDGLWSESSFAFRPSSRFGLRAAIQKIQDYLPQYEGKSLYVAECDICQFYDCISHDRIRINFTNAVEKARGQCVDIPREAIVLFEKYLSTYDYQRCSLPVARACKPDKYLNCSIPDIPDGLEQLYGDSLSDVKIGIPQGSAPSPLVANMAMDSVDQAVLADKDPDLLYVRFCDDMVLIHPNEDKCVAALQRYTRALETIKVIHHPFVSISPRSPDFEDQRSKNPYLWVSELNDLQDATETLAFLGYKIRRDGTLSLREKTLRKHQKKLHRLVAKTIRFVSKPAETDRVERPDSSKENIPSLNGQSLLWLIRKRMISSVVGRENLMREGIKISQPCWASAFDLLPIFPAAESIKQLHHLDSIREQKIRFLAHYLRKQNLLAPKEQQGAEKRNKKFYGAPYSYFSLAGETNRSRIKFSPRLNNYFIHYTQI